jgi:hypothetical protein
MVDGENCIGKLTILFNSQPFQHFLNIFCKKNFIRKKLVPYSGMKNLIELFYESIQEKKVLPVTREDALNTAHVIQ